MGLRPPSAGSGAEVAGRAWAPSTAYKAGDLVTQAGTLYRANADFTSGASFNVANWTAVTTGSAARVVQGGNLGATSTLALGGDKDVWLVGTLTANLTLTLTGITAGARAKLLLTQDATGGRTLTISDGTNSQAVVIPTGAGGATVVDVESPDGTDLYVDVAGGSGPGANEMPWRAEINPFTAPSAQTTFANLSGVSALIGGGTKESTGAQNSEINWDVLLGAGTWTLSLIHRANPDRGIYTVLIDGVSVGTIDGYAAALTNNKVDTLAGIGVAAPGKHRLTLRMATKNASSTNYIGSLQAVSLLRTA